MLKICEFWEWRENDNWLKKKKSDLPKTILSLNDKYLVQETGKKRLIILAQRKKTTIILTVNNKNCLKGKKMQPEAKTEITAAWLKEH